MTERKKGCKALLAVLLIEMTWFKENRTPNGASIRKKYDKPVRIEDGINLIGNGIFYKKCCYFQHGDCVLSEDDVSCRPDKELYETNSGKAFTGAQERELRRAGQRDQRVAKVLTQDIFMRDYDHEYRQMADLF